MIFHHSYTDILHTILFGCKKYIYPIQYRRRSTCLFILPTKKYFSAVFSSVKIFFLDFYTSTSSFSSIYNISNLRSVDLSTTTTDSKQFQELLLEHTKAAFAAHSEKSSSADGKLIIV